MASSAQNLIDKLIDKLGTEPCLLAILVIVFLCCGLIIYTYRHQEKMEAMRIQQWATVNGKKEIKK